MSTISWPFNSGGLNLCQEKALILDRRFYLCYNATAFLELELLGVGVNLNLRDPLRLNVGFLLHESVGFSRIFEFDHPSLLVADELPIQNLRGSLRFTRTAQGLYGQGRLMAQLGMECVRCLESFHLELSPDINELFVYPAEKAEDPLLAIPETGMLDLNPLLREFLVLHIPLQPVCRPGCRGLCAQCGNNLNYEQCDHPQDNIDPRLAALKSLLSEP